MHTRASQHVALKVLEAMLGETSTGMPGVYPAAMSDQQTAPLCIENRTSDPVNPYLGQIWLRTDL